MLLSFGQADDKEQKEQGLVLLYFIRKMLLIKFEGNRGAIVLDIKLHQA